MRLEVGCYVKSIYEFAAQQSGELSLQVGDVIKVTDEIDGNWLQGEAVYGASGTFPASFVEPIVLPTVLMGQRLFVALTDFPCDQAGDLELAKGEIIIGLEEVDENWWKGKNGPLRGMFPLNCVHELQVTTEGPRSRSASLRGRSLSLRSRADSLGKMSEMMFARALVDVVPQIEGELGFQVGDLITITEVVDDDWFYGDCHNKVGLVSTICVEFLDSPDNGDYELGAGHSDLRSSDNPLSVGCNDKGETVLQASSEKSREEVENSATPVPSHSYHTGRNTLQHAVSYTSENTRSHDAEITPYAKTLYSFQAQLPSELSFGDNEIVTLIQHIDEDWIEGELDGKTGLFPASFVEIIVDCPYAYDTSNTVQSERHESFSGTENSLCETQQETETVNNFYNNKHEENSDTIEAKRLSQTEIPVDSSYKSATLSSDHKTTNDQKNSETDLALVLHSFQGEMQGDLSVREGDTIEIIRIIDSNWLEARSDRGVVGLVPKNHVQVIQGAPQSRPSKTSKPEKHASVENSREGDDTSASLKTSEEHKTISAGAFSPKVQISDVQSSSSIKKQDTSSNSVYPIASESSQSNTTHLGSHQLSSASHRPPVPTNKPALPLKPKLAPKPVIKPKPFLTPKPFFAKQGSPKAFGHVASPTEKRASQSFDTGGRGDPKTNDKKVFSGVDLGLSLDNIVQVELEKAKSDGERSRGSSIIGEETDVKSGSFSSSVSDEQAVSMAPFDSMQGINVASLDSFKSENAPVTDISDKISTSSVSNNVSESQNHVTDYVHATEKTKECNTRLLSDSGFETPPPLSPLLNNKNNTKFSTVSKSSKASSDDEALITSKVSHRQSMPPSRPAPPVPKADSSRSFVNEGFEHESEAQLISLDVTGSSHPPPPTRAVPRPPPPVFATSERSGQDLLGDTERRVKRPPPRPTGPRIAPVPSKTPLQPMKADNSKPIPHRPAPPAPGNRHSLPLLPGSAPTAPPSTSIPLRPVSVTGGPPPKRPPPRLQKSANDLMRFSPEPVAEDSDENEDLIADLKKRLQENNSDIQKYEQSKQELEKQLEESKNSETEDNLQFVIETLHGLREEEQRLKGNLFSLSPREEKLEKAKLLADQRLADQRLRKAEEQKSAAEERLKLQEKRQKVLQELLETEKDYLFDLHLCLTSFFDSESAIKVPNNVDIDFLFGNMEEIADVSQRLLTSLESAISGKEFQDQIVGSAFVALAEDMKNTYAPYCRHHDDVIAVMEKYREIPEACQYFAAKVEEMRRRTNIFDVEAMLIKPVQRILKYPLLLHELIKCTEQDHPDKAAITSAIKSMTDVATAINEYKRRKDLVFKYKRDSDESFAMKIAKLNFHSIKKKSSRMRGRLSTNLGIGLQLRDENFEQEETRFRAAEKAVKILLRHVMAYREQMQDMKICLDNFASDISDYFGEKTSEEMTRYLTVHRELQSHYNTLTSTIDSLVVEPLNRLVIMLNGPNNVIDKRFDKLLDYNNLLGRGKDEKLVQAAKNDYEAMNAQLLDELPKLYQLTLNLVKHCMAAYVRAQRDFQDHALKENCLLLELPAVLGGSENVMENFNIRHTAALDQISMLSFIPRGFNPKMDSFKPDRRGSSRQSFDTSKPTVAFQPSSSSQSDSQRAYLRQMYGAENLYQVMQTMPAHDLMDMAVTMGTLVAVIKDKDPMGGRQRWFVDDGANKGFVQSSILTKPSSSPTGSLSSLTADESDDFGSVYTSGDDGEGLPWLSSHSPTPYPEVTEVSQVEASPSTSSDQPTYEYYSAEYPFQARSSNEVTLFAGQVVVVLNYQDLDGNSEWWLVDADGYQGYAPANYLRKM